MTLDVKVEMRSRALTARLNQWYRGISGDLLNRLGQRVEKQTRQRLRSDKTSPDGEAWPPRVSDRFSHPLLDKTGKLIRSIRRVREAKELVRVSFDDAPYGKFHQKGTRKVARRSFLGLSSEDVQDLENLVDSWVASHG